MSQFTDCVLNIFKESSDIPLAIDEVLFSHFFFTSDIEPHRCWTNWHPIKKSFTVKYRYRMYGRNNVTTIFHTHEKQSINQYIGICCAIRWCVSTVNHIHKPTFTHFLAIFKGKKKTFSLYKEFTKFAVYVNRGTIFYWFFFWCLLFF